MIQSPKQRASRARCAQGRGPAKESKQTVSRVLFRTYLTVGPAVTIYLRRRFPADSSDRTRRTETSSL